MPQHHKYINNIKQYKAGLFKAPNKRIIKLSSNENPYGASPMAISAYRDAAIRLNRYPDGGSENLRRAIAEKFNLNYENIVCGVGSSELISLLIRSYVGPNDEIVHTEYGFLLYPIYAQTVGAIPIAAKEQNLTVDVDAILNVVTDKTKIVFIANPNNPTGTYISYEKIKHLRSNLPSNILLVIDSAYAEYVAEKDYSSCHALVEEGGENVVVLHTFSKIFGLSGLRIGWGYCPQPTTMAINKIRGPFNISTPSQAACVAALNDDKFIHDAQHNNIQNRKQLQDVLEAFELKTTNSVANFVLTRFHSVDTAQKVYQKLLAEGVIVRNMEEYCLPDYLRITVGLPEENEVLINNLNNILNN